MMTYNMNSLASRQRRLQAREFIEGLHQLLDVLCIQEHHLHHNKTTKLSNEVWRATHFVTAPAEDGEPAARNARVTAGKGGVCLAFGPKIKSSIVQEGIMPSHRAVWACLENEKNGKIGILGLYAPNDACHKTTLWREIFRQLDFSYKWVILGDYNMIEHSRDQKGGTRSVVSRPEKRAWKHFLRRMKVEDSFCYKVGHLKFSWDSKKQFCHVPNVQSGPLGDRILRRIDRIYVPDNLTNTKFTASSSTILPGFAFSDHAPALLSLFLAGNKQRPQCRMNTSHISDPELQRKIKEMWDVEEILSTEREEESEEMLHRCLYKTRKIAHTWGKQKAAKRREEETKLRETQTVAQLLQADPQNVEAQSTLKESEEAIIAFEKVGLNGEIILCRKAG